MSFARLSRIVALVALSLTLLAPASAADFPYQLDRTPGSASGVPTSDEGLGIEAGLQAVERDGQLPQGVQREQSVSNLILSFVGWGLGFYGVVATLLVIYFGVRLIAARENPDERKKAVQGLINLTIGTVLIYLSFAIVSTIVNLANSGALQEQALEEQQRNAASNAVGN